MRWLRSLLFVLAAPGAVAATYVWTGGAGDGLFSDSANWANGVAPTHDSSAVIIFGDKGAGTIRFDVPATISQIQFQNSASASYSFASSNGSALTLQNGITSSANGGSSVFGSSVQIHLSSAQTLALNSGTIEIDGSIDGPGSLVKTGSGSLKLTGFNSWSGGLTNSGGTLSLDNIAALGSGTLHLNGGQVVASGPFPLLIVNPVSIEANTVFSGVNNQATVFNGTVTLDKSVTLTANNTQAVFFTGNIVESGGARQLVISGLSPVVLTGTSSYTGGTDVEGGTLVFGVSSAVPKTGIINASSLGYVGVAFTDNLQSNLIAHLDDGHFTGTIGFETAPWQNAPTVFSSNLNLSGVVNYKALSTFTTAELAGQITVASGTDYRFGGGGGTLYLDSNLGTSGQNLQVVSPFGKPLTLVLRGLNTYRGATNVLDSVLVLDRANTLPSTSALNLVGPGYIGITENAGLRPNDFFRRVNQIGSGDAIVGIDSANLAAPRTVSDAIDLSLGGTRSQPYYLGTSTRVTLTGAITPPKGSSLYLTAIKGGYLTVDSTLGSSIPALVVGQTNSFDPEGGTVELAGSNSYRGGTDVRGGLLRVSNSNALGLGGVTVDSGATLSVASNTTIANALSLSSGATLSGTGTLASSGGVYVGKGAILSPGGLNNFGKLTFTSGLTLAGGGVLQLDTFNLNGVSLASDTLSITGGGLTLASTGGSPFVISLNTIGANVLGGLLGNFNDNLSYHWTFATANSITGFASNDFTFDTTHFLNPIGSGNFFVTQNGNSLVINFTPVPEPSTYALLALGLGLVFVAELRRRKR